MKSGKPKNRACFVRYRVSPEEYLELTARAEREGLTLSDFLRAITLCVEPPVIRTRPEPGPGEISPGEMVIVDQIRRVGVNINQIAHMQNMLRVPSPPELGPLLLEIRRYMDFVWARQTCTPDENRDASRHGGLQHITEREGL